MWRCPQWKRNAQTRTGPFRERQFVLASSNAKGKPSARDTVAAEWLEAHLNSEILKFESCSACEITGIMQLGPPDDAGCNWAYATLRCSGEPAALCRAIAERVIDEAKTKFNLL